MEPPGQPLALLAMAKVKVNLDLEHVTLKQTLRAFRRETGFAFVPQQFAILLCYSSAGCGVYVRTFPVPEGFFSIKAILPEATYDVKDQLEPRGVLFPPGASAEYSPGKSQLVMVNASLDEMDKVEDLLEKTR